jgi:hypothetical protein
MFVHYVGHERKPDMEDEEYKKRKQLFDLLKMLPRAERRRQEREIWKASKRQIRSQRRDGKRRT